METKFIIFWAVAIIGIPLGAALTRLWKPALRFVFVFMVLSLNEVDRAGINFFSREHYRMVTRGLEFTLVDIFMAILLLGMLLRPADFKIKWLPKFSFIQFCYMACMVVSWLLIPQSHLEMPPVRSLPEYTIYPPDLDAFEIGLYPIFEMVKFMRAYLIFWVSINYLSNTDEYFLIPICCALNIYYSTAIALQHRYIHGVYRVTAHLGHANSLAVFMGMNGVVVLLAAVQSKKFLSSLLFLCAAGFSIISVILTVSRAGLFFLLLGFLIIAIITIKKYLNARNIFYIAGTLVCLFIFFIISFDTLKQRFFQDAVADYRYRDEYNVESILMVQDNFFGVGAGNYSAFSWHEYAERVDEYMYPGTPAHNFIYLNLAELGYFGLLFFVLLWVGFYFRSYVNQKKLADPQWFLQLAIMLGVSITLLMELLNFTYRQTPVLFTLMLFLGTTVSLTYKINESEAAVEDQ